MTIVRTVVVTRSMGDSKRYAWEDFRKRGGPLVELLEGLDMNNIEIRWGEAMSGPGVVPSVSGTWYCNDRDMKKAKR